MKKIVYIMRGLPGSGKSYTCKQLVPAANIYSTDDFWGEDYDFDFKKLGIAHGWNLKRTKRAMFEGHTPIAVDNTNVCLRDFKNYLAIAKEFDYDVIYQEPESEWWKEIAPILEGNDTLAKETQACFLAGRNQHGVPKEAILRMMGKWTPTASLPV